MRLSVLLAVYLGSACTNPDDPCVSLDECGDSLCADGRCVSDHDGMVDGDPLDGEFAPDAGSRECDGPDTDTDDDGVQLWFAPVPPRSQASAING